MKTVHFASALVLAGVLGLASLSAQADGGVISFSGAITSASCSTAANPSGNSVAMSLQCGNSMTHKTLSIGAQTRSVNNIVAAVSVTSVAPRGDIMLVEYR